MLRECRGLRDEAVRRLVSMVSGIVRRDRTRPRVAVRTLRLAVLVGVVIAGLLAMHVLGVHASPLGTSGTTSPSVHANPALAAEEPAGTGEMCAMCDGGGEAGMALACAIALLVALILRSPNRLVMGRADPLAKLFVVPVIPRADRFPAPLRHALCIMRT